MPRVFRFPAERGWLELQRSPPSKSDSVAKDQPTARLYPPQQVVHRWEDADCREVLYELKSGDFARVDFDADGEFVSGYQIPRKGSGDSITSFFEKHDLIKPFHL